MATIKSEYYRFDGAEWDLHYFRTSADLIVETASYKVLTTGERDKITTYLSTFNAASKLLQLDTNGLIPTSLIPGGLSYLPLAGGTLTGELNGTDLRLSGDITVGGTTNINGTVTSDGEVIYLDVEGINFDGEGGWISNLKSPEYGHQSATKEYVDNLVAAGFKVKEPVKAASTANITITAALNVLDGYSLAANDRVLIKNQTNTSENGVYTLNASKIPAKVVADSSIGNSVFVEHGLTQNDYIFVCSVANTWSMFSKPDTITAAVGGGLSKSGTALSIAVGGIKNSMIPNLEIAYSKLKDYAITNPTGDWSSVDSSKVDNSLDIHLSNAFRAIKLLRGTGDYSTNNTQTIAGAYTLANSKITCEVGASVPGNTGFVKGDLFFKTIA